MWPPLHWEVPTGQQWEQGRVPAETAGAGQGLSTVDSPQHPQGGHREELGAAAVHPKGFHPLIPSREEAKGGLGPRAAQLGASLLISSSGQCQRYCPVSPIFHFLQGIFSLSHPHWRGPRQRTGSALAWLGWGAEQQPQPHCVPLSAPHFHLLCSHEQLHGLCWVYLQCRERG